MGDKCAGKVHMDRDFHIINDSADTSAAETPGVTRAAEQYGILSRLVDCATFDVTRNPWRRGNIFDAIVTDPPCSFLSTVYVK